MSCRPLSQRKGTKRTPFTDTLHSSWCVTCTLAASFCSVQRNSVLSWMLSTAFGVISKNGLHLANSMMNPFVYSLRMPVFNVALKKLKSKRKNAIELSTVLENQETQL